MTAMSDMVEISIPNINAQIVRELKVMTIIVIIKLLEQFLKNMKKQ
jgi:hypothetical protein